VSYIIFLSILARGRRHAVYSCFIAAVTFT